MPNQEAIIIPLQKSTSSILFETIIWLERIDRECSKTQCQEVCEENEEQKDCVGEWVCVCLDERQGDGGNQKRESQRPLLSGRKKGWRRTV